MTYCRQHDEPTDRTGKCPECHRADAEYAELDRDCLSLWERR